MSKPAVYVRMELTFRVMLPEAVVDDGEGTPTAAARRRAIAAVLSMLPGGAEDYSCISEDTAHVELTAGSDDVTEAWCE